MKLKSIIILVFLLVTLINAMDRPAMEFYGFSRDGRYCAFELHGAQDGSGFPYSEIYIIDVDENKYATKPITTIIRDESFDVLEARKSNLNKGIPYLRKYRIDTSVKGTLLFDYPDYDKYQPNRNKIDYYSNTFYINDTKYILRLAEKDTGRKDQYGFDDVTIKMFKLVLIDAGNNKEILLQNDTKLPKNRESAKKYRLSSAHYFNGKIVVFVEYEDLGFEGNDQIKLAVTAKIADKP